jgi:hypothetical protein
MDVCMAKDVHKLLNVHIIFMGLCTVPKGWSS